MFAHLFSLLCCLTLFLLVIFSLVFPAYFSFHTLTFPTVQTSIPSPDPWTPQSRCCAERRSACRSSVRAHLTCVAHACVCLCTLLSVHPACCLYCPHSYLWQKPFLTQRGKADIFQGDISYFKIHSKYFWAWGMELDYATFPLLLLLPFPPSYCSFLYVIIHKTSWQFQVLLLDISKRTTRTPYLVQEGLAGECLVLVSPLLLNISSSLVLHFGIFV